MLIEGLFLPLTTPYLPDGGLNLRKLEDNVARYSKTPAAGMIALGQSGQPSLLSDAETRDALRVVAATAIAEKVLIAGVARDSVHGTLDLIAFAHESLYDAALVPVPWILRKGRRAADLLSFFRAVADRAALPIVLESGDGEIAVELVVGLAQHPNVIGILDSSGDASRIVGILNRTTSVKHHVTVTPVFSAVTGRMQAKYQPAEHTLILAGALSVGDTALSVAPPALASAFRTRTKIVGFQVLSGSTSSILDALLAGAVGAAPSLAACAPQACYEIVAAWKDGDPALAAEKQERVRVAGRRVEQDLGVPGLKYGCDLNGYFGGRPRLPELPLTEAQREEVESLLSGLRN